jgi:parallel beta-helix repeat protein
MGIGINVALRAAAALAIVTVVSAVGCSDGAQPSTERITAPTSALASLTSGTGSVSTITSRVTGSPCVTVVNESNAAGTQVEIWNCYGSPAQSYSWMADGSIRAFPNTTPMCLGTAGTGQDGDRIVIQACNGSAAQKWTASTANEIRGLNGKCLDIVNASSTNGARLMLWNCYGSPSQKWDNAVSVTTPPPAPAPVATVSVSLTSSLPVGQTAQATATLRDASGNVLSGTVAWTSSNTAVASVSASGLVTAVAAGSANIVATSGGKTGSAALTVTAAVTGVAVLPGQSIQAAVNANPAGTTFILKAGTHTGQSVIPKSGDVFQGEVGTILDGKGAPYAFSKGNAPFPSNVTIRGLKITGYTPPMQSGAIQAGDASGVSGGTTGWVIDGNEVSYNAEYGIRIGNNGQVINNNVHHNMRLNIAGSATNTLVANNEIAFGNYQSALNTNFEAGGTKFAYSDGLILRGNYVHDNVGVGLHMDMNNINTTIESNRIDKNGSEGVVIEISYATIIRNNTVTNNGWADPRNRYTYLWNAGIGVHSSQNVEIYGNTVSGNYAGIVGIEQDRSADPAVYGPHIIQNLYVHDNTVTQNTLPRTSGALSVAAGLATDIVGNTALFTSRNNRFVNNTYFIAPNPYPFAWQFGVRTAAQWKAYGQDVTGIFN